MENDLYSIFDAGGLLNQVLGTYEYREDQIRMASDVSRCFDEKATCGIEAGTGTGKSFAYLVPALLKAFENPDERTVIATSTKTLQLQLKDKDIPTLFNTFGKQCNVELAVGRNEYLCLSRLSEELESVPLMLQDVSSQFSELNGFASSTETGLRSEYRGRHDDFLWSKVCSEADLCHGFKCRYYSDCFYYKAKKKIAQAQIIICNHHLLFVDSATRMESNIDYDEECILPGFSNLVIDEAHNIERHATDLFTAEFSSSLLRRQLDFIYNMRWHKGAGIRLLELLAPYCPDKELFEKIVNLIGQANGEAETLNSAILSFMEYNKLEHVLLTKNNAQLVINEIKPSAEALCQTCSSLVSSLTIFASKLQLSDDDDYRREDLTAHGNRVSAITDVLKTFVNYLDWNDDIHFLEVAKTRDTKTVFFKISPLDVAPILKEALFNKVNATVCTSATMNLGDNFRYWCNCVGLPADRKKFTGKVYNSPFDYANNLLLLTPHDCPDYSKEKEDEYAAFLCDSIGSAVESSGGGALVLFTSYKLMNQVAATLRPRFEAMGINSIVQGEADRYSLLEQFKTDTDSVLFATSSFWEGVDAPGNTLRLVIITKLPFRMPDEPIYKARLAKMAAEGRNGFYEMTLPDAVLKLKQGFGRLMRHSNDRGIVIILDSRIVKKFYGASMLASLPHCNHPECSMDTLGSYIENFLY